MSVRLRTTCMVALCAMLNSTAMLLFAGIAAACSGNGDPDCSGKPAVTTSSTGSISPTGAYVYGYVDPNNCKPPMYLNTEKAVAAPGGKGAATKHLARVISLYPTS